MKAALTIIIALLFNFELSAQLVSGKSGTIRINLGWSHQFQFAGYYAALEKGYFLEEGLDVKLISEIREDNIGTILDGTYEYGIATGGVILEDERFDRLSVVAAIYQQSPVSLLTLNTTNISSLNDIEGRDILGGTEIRAMLISSGVDMSTVKVQGKVSNFEALLNGDVDATSFFITDQTMLLGNDSLLFKIWRPIEYGINFYGECLITSRTEAKSNPERVQKIKTAIIKGWQYTIEHPEEMVDIIISKYNPNLNRNVLIREANIIIHNLILPGFYDIGDMQISKWMKMAKIIHDFGIISKPRDLSGFIFKSEPEIARSLKIIIWISLLIIALAIGFLFILFLYNTQLRKAVRSRTESLEKANEEMDRFVYSISHDIRSPLTSVQGLVNLMKVEKEGYDKYLNLIDKSIKKLDSYTLDILDYTRNSRTKLNPQPIDLTETIDRCLEQVKYTDALGIIDFKKEIQAMKPFLTDGWRLEVVLTNLLSNAVKYRDPEVDHPYVRISASLSDTGAMFEIEDNGLGIEKIHLNKIFDMFYRASEDSQGSGMGLYIVKETVDLLGGEVKIKSQKNKGTCIQVFIPEKTI